MAEKDDSGGGKHGGKGDSDGKPSDGSSPQGGGHGGSGDGDNANASDGQK